MPVSERAKQTSLCRVFSVVNGTALLPPVKLFHGLVNGIQSLPDMVKNEMNRALGHLCAHIG